MAVEVDELFARFGTRVDTRSWAQADAALSGARQRLSGLTGELERFNGSFVDGAGKWRAATGRFLTMKEQAVLVSKGVGAVGASAQRSAVHVAAATQRMAGSWGQVRTAVAGVAAYMGLKLGYQSLIKVNATAEETKNQIAGMLALSKKTDFRDQLGTANDLMESLRQRAASLPGTTSEYVAMLGNIVQPVSQAGLGMKDLEELTVGAVVAAKALREDAGAAARDVGQALRGQAGADDPFIGKLLDTAGYVGEEGRKRFNTKSAKERAEIVKQLLTSKQLRQMAEAQGNTFSGVMSTLQDSAEQFLARVGKPLFEALGNAIRGANEWLKENSALVEHIADVVGGALKSAFETVGEFIKPVGEALAFLAEDSDTLKAVILGVLGAMAGFALVAAGPMLLVAGAITGIVLLVKWIKNNLPGLRAGFRHVFGPFIDGAKEAIGYLARMADGVAAIPGKISEFFTETLPEAIKRGLKAAFEWVRNLPVIKQIIDAMMWVKEKAAEGGVMGRIVTGNAAGIARDAVLRGQGNAPSLPAGSAAPMSAPVSISGVSVGDINVTSNASDPKAVADEVSKSFATHFASHLGAELRRSGDEAP